MGFQYRNRLIDVDLDVGISTQFALGCIKLGKRFLMISDIHLQKRVVELGSIEIVEAVRLCFIWLIRVERYVLLLSKSFQSCLIRLVILRQGIRHSYQSLIVPGFA